MHAEMETNVQAGHGARCGPMVKLLGGSNEDPFGDNAFVKKIKRGEYNWGILKN